MLHWSLSILRTRSYSLRVRSNETLSSDTAPDWRTNLTQHTRATPRHRRISLLFDVFAVSNRVRVLLRQGMANADLRPDDYAIYSAVFKAGPLTISELAAVVGMPLTTVSDYVQTMASRGHARPWENPLDS